MLFNSTLFLQFFAAFLLFYYIVRNDLRARNLLLIAASYVFYGAWNWRFLFLLIFSSFLDFFVGRALQRMADQPRRKALLTVSIVCNLTILGFFKYFDFFVGSMADLMNVFGIHFERHTLGILLPVGISFYTFQSMSYAIDVYRRKIAATGNIIQFFAYVSFFPQLVAGPIERAGHMLPQFSTTRKITASMIREGLWLAIWGMFKKVVIADNLAPLSDLAFRHSAPGAAIVVLGAIAFALQIYCDFSGYSDIARGTARILGFDLMLNFNLPYTATSVREFWQRWHISLSTWLRDYVYIPLGGNRLGQARTHLNLFLTMLLGGFWHGAKWTFVLWGAWQGLGLIVHRIWSERRTERSTTEGSVFAWFVTIMFVLLGWIFFRADSSRRAMEMISQLANPTTPMWFHSFWISLLILGAPLVAIEIWQRKTNDLLAPLTLPVWALAMLEGICLLAIMLFWERQKTPFIYFQF
jgi:alginate O-acetyltransferase complex protein AlgI